MPVDPPRDAAPPSMSGLLEQDDAARPVGTLLAELAERDPDRSAVTCGESSISRAELERGSNRLARAFARYGVGHGDFVTIALPNSVEFFLATVAVWKLGAVPQPVSWRLPARELQAILALARPALIVGVDQADHPDWTCLPAGFTPDGELSDDPLPPATSPAWKAPTSGGSTGRPKVIVSSQPALFTTAAGAPFGMSGADCQLVPGPLYHNSPFTLSSLGLFMGQHLVVLESFDATAALEAIGRYRVGWMNLVPTMMQRMSRAIAANPGRFELSSLRCVWHMAAPCPEWLKEAWIELVGPDTLMELYGGTEAQALTAISGTEWLAHRGSVGKPVLGEMTVLNAEGAPAAPGEVGEIFMRSPVPTYSYIGARPHEVNGWESLGDLGWIDEDGYFYLSDRRSDLIIAGGANIYPAEVESVIAGHPRVHTCVVVGLPDDDLGQRPHAVVEAEGVTERELLDYVAERLVRYKVPRSAEFVDEPLRDDAGKVRRSAVRDAAIARLRGERATSSRAADARTRP